MRQGWCSEALLFTTIVEGTVEHSDGEDNGDMMAAIDDAQALQLELTFQTAEGAATVHLRGELDIATADAAFAYLRDVVDSQLGPVLLDLSELIFCDAAGLGVLARIAGYAHRAGRPLSLTAARPSLVRIMRITAMDEAFPEIRDPALAAFALPRQASMTAVG